jgi:hypothetical protein
MVLTAIQGTVPQLALEWQGVRVEATAMTPHLYVPTDATTVDHITNSNQGHNIRLDRDRIVLLGDSGLLVWRAGGIVHELHTGNGLGQKQRADLLVRFAIGDAVRETHKLHEAIFLTDSDRMAGYALSIGAIEETGKRVFSLDLRRAL